jgi:hypothetical protein
VLETWASCCRAGYGVRSKPILPPSTAAPGDL